MNPPTKRQLEILAFMRDHMTAEGMPPTIAEIGSHFGLASSNGVHEHLRAMEKRGLVERTAHKTRTWRPTATATKIIPLEPSQAEAGATCTPTIITSDAMAVGETLRALARSQPLPKEALEMLERVGGQLSSAARAAMAGVR